MGASVNIGPEDWLEFACQIKFNSEQKSLYALTSTALYNIDISGGVISTIIEDLSDASDFDYFTDNSGNLLFCITSLEESIIVNGSETLETLEIPGATVDCYQHYIYIVNDLGLFIVNTHNFKVIGQVFDSRFKGSHRIVTTNSGNRVFIISRILNTLITMNISDKTLPFVEYTYSSHLLKEPRQILYNDNYKILFVTCYHSRNILMFETSQLNAEPRLIRNIEMIENPCGIFFSNNYLYIASNNGINGLSYISLWPQGMEASPEDLAHDAYLIRNTYPETFHMGIEYNNIFIDPDQELLIAISKKNKTVDLFDSTVFNDTTTNKNNNTLIDDHHSSLEKSEHHISNINRDIDGHITIELDTYFDNIKHLPLDINNDEDIINVSNQLVISLDILNGYSNS